MKKLIVCGFSVLCVTTGYSQGLSLKDKEAFPKKGNALILNSIPGSTSISKQEIVTRNWADPNSYKNNKEALVLWQQLLSESPDNSNLNYKAGLCYFFSYDEQHKALPYLKKAIKSLTADYDFNKIDETKAPLTALYFLAESYLDNNQPDSAIKYFSVYRDKQGLNAINAERSISMSFNAKNSEKNPRNVKVNSLGSSINTSYSESNPVANIKNTVLFFASNRPGKEAASYFSDDIYISSKGTDGNWSEPQAFPHNTKFDESPLHISLDGQTLYFKRHENGHSDIYVSRFANNSWSKPEPFKEVNSSFNEEGFTMTGDGKILFFSSDRNKQLGRYDIFKCVKDKKGKWSSPILLSSKINTAFDEVSPFVTPDGSALFFSSNFSASKGLGNLDVYYSEFKGTNGWAEPQNMSYPINKCRNDINYYISSNDIRYYSSLTENNAYDLFEVQGGGFDFESLPANLDVMTVTNEMAVTSVMETETKVEKEVEVTKTVETEVVKEKEVEITKAGEEQPKEIDLSKMEGGEGDKAGEKKEDVKVSDVNMDNLSDAERAALIEKVKSYLTEQLKANEAVKFKIIYFDFNKSNLSLLSLNELKLLIEFLGEHSETKIEIAGHGDNKGSWSTNLQLADKRAKEVYDFLMRNKVSPDRMFYYGKGSAVPIAPNDTEENRAKNRRVEVFILK